MKSIMNKFAAAAVAFLAAMCASAALPESYSLKTASTEMDFRMVDGKWCVDHYGERMDAASNTVAALAWNRWNGNNDLGQRQPSAYSTFGSKNPNRGSSKFGGLAVTHADGTLSTDLCTESVEVVEEAGGVVHLVARWKDRSFRFYVTQHFCAIPECDVIETWAELENREDGPVRVVRMDSLSLVLPLVADDFSVMSLTGQWCCENRLVETVLGLGQTLRLCSRSGVRDTWGGNPAFMLSLGGPAGEAEGRVVGGALAWSGAWNIEIERDFLNLIELRAGADTSSGAYTLDKGRSITLPKFALTYSGRGKGQVSRNLHRWARNRHMPNGRKLRPVLLNHWESAGFKFDESLLCGMMDGAAKLGVELFVMDDGWFGRGRYARNNASSGIGDWVVNDAKLPGGIHGLVREAERRGMRFGLWMEPEMANTNSAFATEHPDWIMREDARELYTGRGHSQIILDFANPAAIDGVASQIDAIFESAPNLAYIKWDANDDFMNPGSKFLPRDRQANLWFDYTTGLYSLLAHIRARHPEVAIQACASGGGRTDYGFLHYADEVWPSDNSDAHDRVLIQWGASQFYPACALAAHVTAVPNQQTQRTTPLKYRFDVAMTGRLGFELNPAKMSAQELEFSKSAVETYKRIRPVVQQGDLYRHVSPWTHSYAALSYVAEDRSRAVLFVLGMNRPVRMDHVPPLRLQGLDPDGLYKVRELNVSGRRHIRTEGQVFEGRALMGMGLPVRLSGGDCDSAVVELAKETR